MFKNFWLKQALHELKGMSHHLSPESLCGLVQHVLEKLGKQLSSGKFFNVLKNIRLYPIIEVLFGWDIWRLSRPTSCMRQVSCQCYVKPWLCIVELWISECGISTASVKNHFQCYTIYLAKKFFFMSSQTTTCESYLACRFQYNQLSSAVPNLLLPGCWLSFSFPNHAGIYGNLVSSSACQDQGKKDIEDFKSFYIICF